MKWVTRERAKVDRIACPWLIRRFVDPAAEFLFVPPDMVEEVAQKEGAIPFDAAGVELTHYREGDREYVSFDSFQTLKAFRTLPIVSPPFPSGTLNVSRVSQLVPD